VQRTLGGLSLRLYWRTFFLIMLLVGISLGAWFQTFRMLQIGPQVRQTSRQITSMLDLGRIALQQVEPGERDALLRQLAQRQEMYILPHDPADRWTPLDSTEFTERLMLDVRAHQLDPLLFASAVNDRRGLWVGFFIDHTPYWLLLGRTRIDQTLSETWLISGVVATLLALFGAAVIAGFVNRPLRGLSVAAARVRSGDYSQRLEEGSGTEEIRAVNRAFNRMAIALHEHEHDRALMLAGISHDIRTPLARLRLEAELSVPDARARRDIVADIEQADAIISQFMEYASSAKPALERVELSDLVGKIAVDYTKIPNLRVNLVHEGDANVLGDPLELQRVIVNLIENARRYGGNSNGRVDIDIGFAQRAGEVVMSVRDHGPGVPDEQLPLLTRPFFRGDRARTANQGTGLGLSIVDKIVNRLGGRLVLGNAKGGGLVVRVWLPRDPQDRGLPPAR
jgi:two-component system osmolarity sensor histidine kinase EnvZ